MKSVQIPGSAWVIILGVINALPAVLLDAYPHAIWVPLVIDLLLVVAKAIEVYKPKEPVEAVSPEPFIMPANYVAASAKAPVIEPSRLGKFLLG